MLKQMTGKLIIIFIICELLICSCPRNLLAKDNLLLDQEKLNKAVGVYIENNMSWPAGTMRFEVLSSLPEISLPAGKVTWKVDGKGNDNYLGDTYLVLKLYNKGILFREEPIKVRIEVRRPFIVSTNNLSRNSVIGVNDVAVQKKWVRSIPLNLLTNMDEVVGKLLCVSLRPNTEITINMLKEMTAVKRNGMVQIVLDNGAINITTIGMAEEDGSEGSMVRVRNTSSNKTIYAKVVGESKVKVDFK